MTSTDFTLHDKDRGFHKVLVYILIDMSVATVSREHVLSDCNVILKQTLQNYITVRESSFCSRLVDIDEERLLLMETETT